MFPKSSNSCGEKVDPVSPVREKFSNGVNTNYSRTCSFKRLLCYAHWQSLFIGLKNSAKPQCFCPQDIKNTEESSLKKTWNCKDMQIYRKKLLNNCFE